MKDSIKVSDIRILRLRTGCDHVYMTTDLPSGVYPFEGNTVIEIQVARGDGPAYVKSHFDIDVEVKEFTE